MTNKIRKKILSLSICITLLTQGCDLMQIIAINGFISPSKVLRSVNWDKSLEGYWLYDENDILYGENQQVIRILSRDAINGEITFYSSKEGEPDYTLPCYISSISGIKFLVVGKSNYFYVRIKSQNSGTLDLGLINKIVAKYVSYDNLESWLKNNLDHNYLVNPNGGNPTLVDNYLRDKEGNKLDIYTDFRLSKLKNNDVDYYLKKIRNIESGNGAISKRLIPDRILTMNGEKYGFRDIIKNEVVINPIYDKVKPFVGDYALVMIKDKWGLIDKNGKVIIQTVHDYLGNVYDGILSYGTKENGLGSTIDYGYINIRNEIVVKAEYTATSDFSEGFGVILVGNAFTNWYFVVVDTNGNMPRWLTTNRFTGYFGKGGIKRSNSNSGFNNGFLLVSRGLTPWDEAVNWGLIDRSGYELIPCEYRLSRFDINSNFVRLIKDEKVGLLKVDEGRWILPPSFYRISEEENTGNFKVYPTANSEPFFIDIHSLECIKVKESECPLDYDILYGKKYLDEIKAKRFSLANTVDDYKFLMLAYPKSSEIEEFTLFTGETNDLNSICENYKKYLNKFPKGMFISKVNIGVRFCDNIFQFNIDSLRDLNMLFPENVLAKKSFYLIDSVENYMDSLNYINVLNLNSDAAYREYISNFPKGKYIHDAKTRLEELVWNKVKELKTISGCTNFISEFPDSRYRNLIESIHDSIYFDSLSADLTISKLNSYISLAKTRTFTDLAINLRDSVLAVSDSLFFYSISNSKSIDGLNSYLKNYPTGRYFILVEKKIDSLRETFLIDSLFSTSNWESLSTFLLNLMAKNNVSEMRKIVTITTRLFDNLSIKQFSTPCWVMSTIRIFALIYLDELVSAQKSYYMYKFKVVSVNDKYIPYPRFFGLFLSTIPENLYLFLYNFDERLSYVTRKSNIDDLIDE